MTGPNEAPPVDPSARPPLPPHLDPRGPGPKEPPPSGPRHRSSRKRVVAWIAGSLAVILLVGAVSGLVTIDRIIAGIKKLDVFNGLSDRPSGGVKGDLNILLVGS